MRNFECVFDSVENMLEFISACKKAADEKKLVFKYVNFQNITVRVLCDLPFSGTVDMGEKIFSSIIYMRVYEDDTLETYLETRRMDSDDKIIWLKEWHPEISKIKSRKTLPNKIIYQTLENEIEGKPGNEC